MVGSRRSLGGGALVALAVAFLPRVAAGAVNQPSGEVMPQPTTAVEISIATSRGFPDDALTLAGLFKYFQGGADAAIDPVQDAQITPGTFSPQCGLTAAIVLKGGACKNPLGWYNATEPATVPTTIYPLVPANLMAAPPNGISCADFDFCPLATRTNTQIGHTWSDPLPEFDPGIKTDPHWAGGKVGLALVGVAGSQCPQTKYSQADLNDKSPSGAPWVTALLYQSRADSGAHYLAFEDVPTCAASWKGCPTSTYQNDGDFNDDVYYVREIACAGTGGAGGGGGAGGSAGGSAGSGGAGASGAGGISGAGGAAGGVAGSGSGGAGGASGSSGAAGAAGTGGISGAGGAAGVGGAGGTGDVAGTAGAGGAGGSSGAGGSGGTSGVAGMNVGAGGSSTGGASGGPGGAKSGGGCGCRIGDRRGGAWSLLCVLLLLRRRRARRSG